MEEQECRNKHAEQMQEQTWRNNFPGTNVEEVQCRNKRGGTTMQEQTWRNNYPGTIVEKQQSRNKRGVTTVEEQTWRNNSAGTNVEKQLRRRKQVSVQMTPSLLDRYKEYQDMMRNDVVSQNAKLYTYILRAHIFMYI